MLNFLMPIGERYGWGICGRYLLRELSELTEVNYIRKEKYERGLFDPVFTRWIDTLQNGVPDNDDHPIFQCIADSSFKMECEYGKPNMGYTFFEYPNLPTESIENAKKFDIMVAGSSWCKEVLEGYGVPSSTIIQGVDKNLFYPRDKELFKDRFVVYSGGKFEYRKGQDIVLAAFKVLQQRHKDVMLICNWYNLWPSSMKTMENSHHVPYRFNPNQNFEDCMKRLVTDMDIGLNNVVFDIPRPHLSLPFVYQNTDVGLFPNRCEGGTNLVFMEYMAMGKPAIASNSTGHKDLMGYHAIDCPETTTILFENGPQVWPEPDLDETIEALEAAYQRKNDLSTDEGIGVPPLPTWAEVAQEFLNLIQH